MRIDFIDQLAIVAQEAHREFTTLLTYVCLTALGVICAYFAFRAFAPILNRLMRGFARLPPFGKVVIVGGLCLATAYGGSKGFWHRVQNDSADTGITFAGLYTATSNEVVQVGGQTVTNEIPMVAAMWTGGTVTAATPVSVRQSNTNDWTELEKLFPYTYTEGTTNILAFATAEDYSRFPFWYLGSNKPATIITTTSIDITSYVETSTYVQFSWTCSQPLATEFKVYSKKLTEANFSLVATTTNKTFRAVGFLVGETRDWKVTATYLEDGE